MTTSSGGLPLSGSVDDADTPLDVIDLLALDRFASGREPFASARELENVVPDAGLLPEGAVVVREAWQDGTHGRLATGDGWTARAVHWRKEQRAAVSVTATSADLADAVLRQAIDGAVLPPPSEEQVPIGFWHLSARGPRRVPRDIETATWPQIRANYSAPVATALESLMSMTADALSGRLLLLHGPPGTGKTTLLRAIARQWRSWCRVDCVLDPERLFAEPSYLMDVALGDSYQEHTSEGRRWRLLLLEDCDELIRGEAKASAGQHLSRLLNLTDGLLGQGRGVLVAITTNENLAALHPAVIRPGRCLAQVEVGPLTATEARAWLDATAGGAPEGAQRAVGPHGATLAELYAARAGTAPLSVAEPFPRGTGLYL